MLSIIENKADYTSEGQLSKSDIANFDYLKINTISVVHLNKYHMDTLYGEIINGCNGEYKRILNLLYLIVLINYKFKNNKFLGYSLGEGNDDILISVTDVDVTDLEEIVKNIDNVFLKFKTYDFISSRKKKDKLKYADLAISKSFDFELNIENWEIISNDLMKKTVLLFNINKKMKELNVKHIGNKVITIINNGVNNKKFHEINYNWYCRLFYWLFETKVVDLSYWYELLKLTLDNALEYKEIQTIINYFDLCSKVNENDKFYYYKRKGEFLYQIAVENESDKFRALHYLTDALTTFRLIPNKYRDELDVNIIISDIELKLQPVGVDIIKNLEQHEVKSELPKELVEQNERILEKIKNTPDVMNKLAIFFLTDRTIKKESVIESSKKIAKNSLHRYLFNPISMSDDGRVIKRSNSINNDDDNDVSKYELECVQQVSIHVSLISLLFIEPTIFLLNKDIDKLEPAINNIIDDSLIIPDDRREIFKKIFIFGFNNDFLTAIHLLCPQIENFIRLALKYSRISTTTITKENEEMELGLSSLLEKDEIYDVFEEDFIFELKMIMSTSGGPNLRNELAHGLLNDLSAAQASSKYIWWRFLRIVFHAATNILTDE